MKNGWFHFTDDQWSELKKELNKYEKADGRGFASNVNMFIIKAEGCCKVMPHLKSAQGLADHRADLERIEKNLKATAKDLKAMAGKNFNIIPQAHIDDTSGPAIKQYWQKNAECSDAAYVAYGPLAKLLEIIQKARGELETNKPPQGRPVADPQGLVTDIARIFTNHIGKPTTYAGGSFVAVVKIILDALGLPAEDPFRAVKKAIQDISPK